MRLEEHPKTLLAILVLALAAGGIGAARTIDQAKPATPAQLALCGLEMPRHLALGSESLPLHEVLGGVGLGTALSVGVKVDSAALPAALAEAIAAGVISLKSPATMVLLFKLDAIVGLEATFEHAEGHDTLKHVEVTCALCHSTVDDSLLPGIGKRRDGRRNRDLDVAAIRGLTPAAAKMRKGIYTR